MTTYGLTKQQRCVLDFIREQIAETTVSPSFEEIREHLGLKSRASVHNLVEGLVERGHIIRLRGRKRSLFLTEHVVRCPHCGGLL